jgi:hypothetical protein
MSLMIKIVPWKLVHFALTNVSLVQTSCRHFAWGETQGIISKKSEGIILILDCFMTTCVV